MVFFVFKRLALPWFGSPLADFLQVLAFSGSWFFAPRTKERKKQRTKDRYILFTSSIPTLKPLLHKKCNVSLTPLNCLPCSTANALQEY